MAYATRADLEQLYGADEVAQRESMLTAGAIVRILNDAAALVDGYLNGRYTLPLYPVPANLPQVVCAIARYSMLGDSATETARDAYKDAIAWLRDVQAGRVLLQAASPAPGNEPATIVMATSSEAVFKRACRP